LVLGLCFGLVLSLCFGLFSGQSSQVKTMSSLGPVWFAVIFVKVYLV
jgi:hypothetical protein